MDLGTFHIDNAAIWAVAAIPIAAYTSRGLVALAQAYFGTFQRIVSQNGRPSSAADKRWRTHRDTLIHTQDTRA